MRLKLLVIGVLTICFFSLGTAYAMECDPSRPVPAGTEELSAYIGACQAKIESLRGEAQTLRIAITTLDSKIRLTDARVKQTTAQIASLEKDIGTLEVVVSDLSTSLSKLVDVFSARARDGYMRGRLDPMMMFFSSDSFAKFLARARYLSVIKTRDRLILSEMEAAKTNYATQKQTKVEKQKQVELLKKQLASQQNDLSVQRGSKRNLLAETQNNEAKYQNLISQARSELEAINAIVSGNGNEIEVRDVSAGEQIASVIPTASCNSSAAHLHFMVAENGMVKNPFNYLKSGVEYLNCSGVDGSGKCFDGDPFNPGGSWDWPVSPKIQLNQGYGVTWAVRNTWVGGIYSSHNGLDIEGSSLEVRAVQQGKLYRGTYSGSNGCALKYVRLDHKDSPLETYYLHVNFN